MRTTMLAVLIVAGLLSGCAIVPDSAEQAALRERPEQPGVHVDLVQAMLNQGKNHAALAHVEELETRGDSDPDQLRWLRARAQYKLGEVDAAKRNYLILIDTPYAARAWHGLGLIAARYDLAEAVQDFNRAVAARPTDAQLRNDLGYTLMQAGRLTEARHHLATATELDPDAVQAQNNLVLSFLVAGQESQAQQLLRSFDIAPARLRELKAQSQVMRRIMASRADEFDQATVAPSSAISKEKAAYDTQNDADTERALPGLYRQRR